MEYAWRSRFSVMLETEIQAREITQEEFATLADVPPATISRLLTGKQERVHGPTLERFAAVMNRPAEMLLEAMRTPADTSRANGQRTDRPPVQGTRILVPADDVQNRVADLAAEIGDYYQDREFVLIGILSGAWMFLADLARQIPNAHFGIDFIRITRTGGQDDYAVSETSDGPVIIQDIVNDIQGKEVLIVEDIADTGETLELLVNHLWAKKPKDVKVCALLDKQSRRRRDITIDFRGFPIPDEWVVGYGLDDKERYRNLPYIGVLNKPSAEDRP